MRSTQFCGVSVRALLVALGALAISLIGAPAAFAAPPANDAFAAPQTIAGTSFNVSGTNLEATAELGEPDHAGLSFNDPNCETTFAPTCEQSVWYAWTAPSTGPFTFQVCNSNYDTTLAIYTGDAVNALTEIGSNDDENCGVSGLGSVVPFNAVSGTVYRIAVAGFVGETGTFTLSDAPPPPPIPDPGPGPVATAPAFSPPPIAPQQQKKKKKKCNKGGKKGGGKKGEGKNDRATASKKKCGKKGGGNKGGKGGDNKGGK